MITDFIITAGFVSVVALLGFGFFQWLDKIEVEKEYLQNLLKEQKRSEYTIRKDV